MRLDPKTALAGVLAFGALGACTVHTRTTRYPEPVGVTEVTAAPAGDYRAYPRGYYEDRVVYYVDGRWGYPSDRGWVYYRSEPPPLRRYRPNVTTAPPAPRSYPYPQDAPPATRTR